MFGPAYLVFFCFEPYNLLTYVCVFAIICQDMVRAYHAPASQIVNPTKEMSMATKKAAKKKVVKKAVKKPVKKVAKKPVKKAAPKRKK